MEDDFGIPLVDFAQGKKQPEMAKLLGVTQSAVSQMINSNREIRVRKKAGGGYEPIEIRLVGRRRAAA
ncbi:hypothetical protein PHLH8_07920 [Pseudomonas sp. Pc102]|uniref:Cro/CI family transcriptional regulator n=1 Tax=Pseudomonas sp. Pc102 TaxID=2678261 RepID=UPI001BCC683B|nr:Cro/CI family transcriptional regulator [Pseudomonas sp. Pc102]BBP81150.1 hypothetical protein PHLH8_07920 [Pseudomonas sp. Pc102]